MRTERGNVKNKTHYQFLSLSTKWKFLSTHIQKHLLLEKKPISCTFLFNCYVSMRAHCLSLIIILMLNILDFLWHTIYTLEMRLFHFSDQRWKTCWYIFLEKIVSLKLMISSLRICVSKPHHEDPKADTIWNKWI